EQAIREPRFGGALASRNPDSAEGPVDEEDLADDVLPGHEPPDARVAGVGPVVALHQVHARWDPVQRSDRWDVGERLRLVVAAVRLHVRLREPLAVDVRVAVSLLR